MLLRRPSPLPPLRVPDHEHESTHTLSAHTHTLFVSAFKQPVTLLPSVFTPPARCRLLFLPALFSGLFAFVAPLFSPILPPGYMYLGASLLVFRLTASVNIHTVAALLHDSHRSLLEQNSQWGHVYFCATAHRGPYPRNMSAFRRHARTALSSFQAFSLPLRDPLSLLLTLALHGLLIRLHHCHHERSPGSLWPGCFSTTLIDSDVYLAPGLCSVIRACSPLTDPAQRVPFPLPCFVGVCSLSDFRYWPLS